MTVVVFAANDGVHGDELWETDTVTGQTSLVKDINPTSLSPFNASQGSSNITDVVVIGGVAYFSAFDGITTSLWRSDGTTAGTFSVTALGGAPLNITGLNGEIYFTGVSGGQGALFKTDGTAAGTSLVANVTSVSNMTAVNGRLLFTSSDPADGNELWVSDGTAAGTHLLLAGTTGAEVSSLLVLGNQLYFTAISNAGRQIWVTDGTPFGTTAITNITTGQPDPGNPLVAFHNKIFFSGFSFGTDTSGLFASDGTPAGETLIASLTLRSVVYVVGDNLMFATAVPGANTLDLYVSDGTAAGTKMIVPLGVTVSFGAAVTVGSQLFFENVDSAHGFELWVSDGTAAGTHIVKDIHPGGASTFVSNMTAVGSSILFTVDDGLHGIELWTSDGTDAGTHLVSDINQTTNPSTPFSAGSFTAAGVLSYFVANDAEAGQDLFVSDGTVAGTHVVANIDQGNPSANVEILGSMGRELFFSAFDGTSQGLYVTDGTAVGTARVSDAGVAPTGFEFDEKATSFEGHFYFAATGTGAAVNGLYSSNGQVGGENLILAATVTSNLYMVGGDLLFSASPGSGNGPSGIYLSDGTSVGTVLVAGTSLGFGGIGSGQIVNSKLYFAADGSTGVNQLWVSDGTASGTHPITSATAATLSVSGNGPNTLTVFGNQVVFNADDSVHGQEVWISDGTSSGTHILSDIDAGATGSSPTNFLVVGNKLFFIANDGIHGRELFVSDGTTTSLVKDVNPGSGDGAFSLVSVNGEVYFEGTTGFGTNSLWVSDGTTAGTKALNISIDAGSPLGANLVVFGNEVLFVGAGLIAINVTNDTGVELSSGLVRSVNVVGDKIYFITGTASNGLSGTELWVSDGTVAGTIAVANAATPLGSNPNDFGAFSNGQNIIGTAGADVLVAGSGNDMITGGGGGDSLTGGAGADTFRYLAASDSTSSAFDIIQDFQTGIDKIDLTDVTPDQVSVVRSNGVSFVFVETPTGSMTIAAQADVNGTDFITGGTNAHGVFLIGDGNGDVLIGSSAGDPIQGGAGNDVITGGGGGDAIFGGAGANTFVYNAYSDSTQATPDGIFDFKTGIDKIDLTALNTTNVSLIRSGGSTFLFADGPGGHLQINIAFHDVNGNDILTGSNHGVFIIGSNDGDTLIGSANGDPIQGGSGNDIIIGGGGGDALFGGAGSNTFKYVAASDSTTTAPDSIFDFVSGKDKIDLSAVRESSTDAFGILNQSGSTFIFVHLDPGQADAHDMVIILNGTLSITTSDIIWGTAPSHEIAVTSALASEIAPTLVGSTPVSHTLLDGGHFAASAVFMPAAMHAIDPLDDYFVNPSNPYQHVAELLA